METEWESGRVAAPVQILIAGDPRWPPGLSELAQVPEEVHVLGQLPALAGAVAIVGTRSCDRVAEAFARALAADLARTGVAIVSGGARGVDTAAHRGALDAQGATVCVLPNYFDAPYPRVNRALFEQIRQGGALLTEARGPCAPSASRCVSRNRLIAALSTSIVVVQAPFRSGALATARYAKALGRDLFAVPAGPWDPRGGGCLELLREGARICTSARDVLSIAAAKPPTVPAGVSGMGQKSFEFRGFDEDQGAVVRALARGPLGADALCEELALSAARVQRALLTLLLAGAIDEVSSGRYGTTGR